MRAARLDAALRGLVAAREVARLPLPPVYAARVDDTAVELFLSPPSLDVPEPWEAHDEGRRWRHPADASDPFTRRRGHAAFPGLVSVGRDAQGGDVLVDLEAALSRLRDSGEAPPRFLALPNGGALELPGPL